MGRGSATNSKTEQLVFSQIGSAPSNPMLPHEIVIELRDLFVLQNTIHWIKSISIEDREGNLQSHGHFKPISSKRFLNDCHEYIFHFTKTGRVEIDRLALGVPYQDKSNISRWSAYTRERSALSWQHLVHSIRNNPEPREGATASGDVSRSTGRMVHQASRRFTRSDDARSVSRNRKLSHCCATLRREKIYRVRNRRDLSRGSEAKNRVAHASRVLAMASSPSRTFRNTRKSSAGRLLFKRLFRRDTETCTRDACATQTQTFLLQQRSVFRWRIG